MPTGGDVVNEARRYIGKVPYVYGGNSLESGADCSGFIQAVYKKLGKDIPRDTVSQLSGGVTVTDPKMGDCVYFATNGNAAGPNGHVGIVVSYLGNDSGIMIDSAPSQGGVGQRAFSHVFGKETVIGYRRFWDGVGASVGVDPFSGEFNKNNGNVLGSLEEVLTFPIKVGKWLADTHNIVRLVQGLLGVIAMVMGVYFVNSDSINAMAKAAKDRTEKVAAVAAMA